MSPSPTTKAIKGVERIIRPAPELLVDLYKRRAVASFRRRPTAALDLKIGELLLEVMKGSDLVARATFVAELKGPRPDRLVRAMRTVNRCHYAGGAVPKLEFIEAAEAAALNNPLLDEGFQELDQVYTPSQAGVVGGFQGRLIDAKVGEAVFKIASGQSDQAREAQLLSLMEGWTRATAKTAVRTSATTAFAAGRLKQAERLQKAGIISALQFTTAGDVDVRSNHAEADGLIARVDDPVWNNYSPPWGYNCRCTFQPVDSLDIPPKLKEGGDIRFLRPSEYPKSKPDSRAFGQKPTLKFYGSRR